MTVMVIEKFYDVVTDVGLKEFEKLNKLTIGHVSSKSTTTSS